MPASFDIQQSTGILAPAIGRSPQDSLFQHAWRFCQLSIMLTRKLRWNAGEPTSSETLMNRLMFVVAAIVAVMAVTMSDTRVQAGWGNCNSCSISACDSCGSCGGGWCGKVKRVKHRRNCCNTCNAAPTCCAAPAPCCVAAPAPCCVAAPAPCCVAAPVCCAPAPAPVSCCAPVATCCKPARRHCAQTVCCN